MLNYPCKQMLNSDFLGVDFNLLYCYEIPPRAFEAVAENKGIESAKSGVEKTGRVNSRLPERSSTSTLAGKASPGDRKSAK